MTKTDLSGLSRALWQQTPPEPATIPKSLPLIQQDFDCIDINIMVWMKNYITYFYVIAIVEYFI